MPRDIYVFGSVELIVNKPLLYNIICIKLNNSILSMDSKVHYWGRKREIGTYLNIWQSSEASIKSQKSIAVTQGVALGENGLVCANSRISLIL